MRTTVNIDDALLTQAREIALRTRRSLGDVVNDALRMLMAHRDRDAAADQVPSLPIYGGSGLQPGVDLDDRDRMAALLDEERDARALG